MVLLKLSMPLRKLAILIKNQLMDRTGWNILLFYWQMRVVPV